MKSILLFLISVAMVGFTSCSKEEMESSLPFGLPGTTIFDMAIDNNSVLYFVTGEIDKSVPHYSVMSHIPYRRYLSTKSEETGKIKILDDRYQGGKIFFDKNNHLLTHDSKTIYRIDGRLRHTIFELPDPTPLQTSLSFIAVDNDNNIWAGGYASGLYKIDDTRLNVTHYHVNNSELPSNYLKNIYIDKNNDIWIATGRSGEKQEILKISNDQWFVYDLNHSDITFPSSIWCMVTDKSGHLWIGGYDNENHSFMRFDGTHWEIVNPRNKITNPRNDKIEIVELMVRHLQSDGHKIYIVSEKIINATAHSSELLTFDGLKWEKIYEVPKDDWIGDLVVDINRQVVWVWTLNKGEIFKIPIKVD